MTDTTVPTPVYSTSVRSTGDGRGGRVEATDGGLALELSLPGSGGPGTNPEQMFAAGYAACFHSALRMAARQDRVDVGTTSVTAGVTLLKSDTGYDLAVTLDVVAAGVTDAVAQSLADAAHRRCPYSRATAGNIAVSVVGRGSD